jgi:hypothetical protein
MDNKVHEIALQQTVQHTKRTGKEKEKTKTPREEEKKETER